MRILFCAHLARAIHDGIKTTTWKPLSPADNARRQDGFTGDAMPYSPGAVLVMDEPWGLVGSTIVFAATFTPARLSDPATPPAGFRPMGNRDRIKLSVVSCSLRRLSTLTEDEALLAGTVPPHGDTYKAEFERQWRSTYRNTLAWDADPFCWRVAFTRLTD
jgi:hypothetical protein